MKIGINFDNTLTDTNYSVIDFINSKRKYEDKILYEEFDNSNISNIWESDYLTNAEKRYRHTYRIDILNKIDLCPLSKEEINKQIDKGNEFYILSSREKSLLNIIYHNLKKMGLKVPKENIILGLNSNEKLQLVIELEIDMYIEDEPEILSKFLKSGVNIVVKDNPYNRNYQNIIRLECYTQLNSVVKRVAKKIKDNKKE